jgi:hypothetical protein
LSSASRSTDEILRMSAKGINELITNASDVFGTNGNATRIFRRICWSSVARFSEEDIVARCVDQDLG